MRILCLGLYYSPEIAASSYIFDNIREAYANANNEIILYVPLPSRGISKKLRMEFKKKKYEEKHGGKLKIYRFLMFSEGKKPIVRAFRYLCCSLIHFWKGMCAKNIDLLWVASTPPTQGLLAVILKKVKKIPILYNLQDIFPDSLVNAGLTQKGSLLWKVGRVIENITYRNVDKIIVISEDFKQNIMDKGVPEEKIDIVYNWVDENAVININRSKNKLFDKYNLDRNKFYITYCGNIGLSQNMDLLLEVAKDLEKYNDICFVLVGDGVYREEVEKIIVKKDIRNLKMIPFQPYEDISHVFSLGDVGLIISKPGIGENSVPSKTWSIMSAERPILASFDTNSELSLIINQNKCGLCVSSGEKELFKDAIMQFYNNRDEAINMGKRGRKYILNNLTREIGTTKYIEALRMFIKD